MTKPNNFGSGADSSKATPATQNSTKTLLAYWANDTEKLYVENSDRSAWIEIPLSAGSSYTDEQVRDVIGAALVAGSNISVTVNDSSDTITLASTVAYSVPVSFTTTPTASEVLLLHVFAESVVFLDDWSGAMSYVGTNPTSTFDLTVNKNGSPVGTITISTSGTVTFSTTGTTVSFATGDLITITAPSTVDSTVANVALTLKGVR